jgi:hypothetical protein
MDHADENEHSKTGISIGRLLIILILLIPVGIILGWLDNTTQLVPDTGNFILASFLIAGVGGLISCGLAIYWSRHMSFWMRIRTIFPALLIGACSTFLISSHSTAIISGWINFPPSKTKSYSTLMLISRAYQTHGKGGGAHIQTMPFWTDLNITKNDYRFMQEHRRPGDAGRDPDEISSKGYFCTRVTIQRAGVAMRIMHAGNSNLPEGSVLVCPLTSESTSPK